MAKLTSTNKQLEYRVPSLSRSMRGQFDHALCMLLAVAAIACLLFPYMYWGQGTNILIQDVLDQDPIQQWRALKQENPFWLSGESNPALFQGTSPAFAGPELRAEWWAYYYLEPFHAFILNQWISRLIAYFGMYFLVLHSLRGHPWQRPIAGVIAILFACLNFYPPTPFTVPILPGMALSFVVIYERKKVVWPWGVLLVSPLLGTFLLAPAFLIGIVWCVWLVRLLRGHWHAPLLAALSLSTIINVICEYPLALRALSSSYVSQRSLWVPMSSGRGCIDCLKTSAANFVLGHTNVHTHHYFLLPILLAVFVVIVVLSLKNGALVSIRHVKTFEISEPRHMFLLMFVLCGICSLIYGFWLHPDFQAFWFALPKVGMINLSRFHWLHPVLWYLAIGYCLAYLLSLRWVSEREYRGWSLLVGVFVIQIGAIALNTDRAIASRHDLPTYREFYAEEQFRDVINTLGKPQSSYYVGSVGIHPAVALYNGFYCLDGYQSDHSLPYHLEFRKIITGELERSDELRAYFDTWGGRCYLFSSELGKDFVCTATKNRKIEELRIDTKAFQDMGGRVLLSAVEIRDAEASNLELLKVFPASEYSSAWTIYLYRAKSQNRLP